MNDEAALRDKLRKIEALFAGAATAGERAAAGAAADRIRAKLKEAEKREKPVEIRFSLPDPWSRQIFIALRRRYGLGPYRDRGMRRQSVIVRSQMISAVVRSTRSAPVQHVRRAPGLQALCYCAMWVRMIPGGARPLLPNRGRSGSSQPAQQ